jgi:hypothetical protein
MLYEWFLIVPTISILCDTAFCGDTGYNFVVTSLDTQDIICSISTGFLWLSMVLAVAVDNGVCRREGEGREGKGRERGGGGGGGRRES